MEGGIIFCSDNPSSSNPSSISTQAVDEAKIQKIMKMGFPRDQVINHIINQYLCKKIRHGTNGFLFAFFKVITELQRSNGDETAAAAALFAKSFKF